jgi:hypothetical protein
MGGDGKGVGARMSAADKFLAEVKARSAAATPGVVAERTRAYVRLQYDVHKKTPDAYGDYYCGFEDGTAHARIDVPRLVAMVEAALDAIESNLDGDELIGRRMREALAELDRLAGGDSL